MRNTDLILETTFIHTDNFVAWYFSVGQGALLTVFDPSSRRLLGKGQAAGSSGQEGGQRSLTLWVSFVLGCGRDRGFPHPRFLADAGGVTIVLPFIPCLSVLTGNYYFVLVFLSYIKAAFP